MKASATQEDLRVTPHPASRRALQVELDRTRAELATAKEQAQPGPALAYLSTELQVPATWADVLAALGSIRAMLAAQDARLAKAGADLEECKKLASGLITDICVEKEARAVAERIARERAATIAKLEPLAEVGRLAALLPVGWWLGQIEPCWQVRMRSGSVHAWGATPLDALQAAKLEIVQARIAARAAGIGEERP